jgi:flagellar biosynthesis protein
MTEAEKPTLAVALKYDAPHAPKVVAVGRGELGQRIIDVAREHGVPLENNAPLAEALSTIELEEEIPEALYAAVATVIAFIMRASLEAQRRAPQHR